MRINFQKFKILLLQLMWVSVGSILKEFKNYAIPEGTVTRVSPSGPDCCKNPQE